MRRAFLLLVMAGCGGGIVAGDFPGAFAKAVCQQQARCRTAAAYEERLCEDEIAGLYAPDLAKAIKAGRAQFVPGQAQKCLDGISAAGCDRIPADVAEACTNAVKGLLATDAQCNWAYECASGLCIPQQLGACPATCLMPVAEGGTCPAKSGAGCDDRLGLRCIASVCSKLHSQGQPCTFDSDCAVALYCSAAGACEPRGNDQASCNAGNECAAGQYCQLFDPGGLCHKKVAQGKPCGEDQAHAISAAVECEDGLVCMGFTGGKGVPVTGTCSAPSDVGGACTTGAGITGCAQGLDCVNGKCALPPSTGPCVDGECLDGTAYCDSAGQCQSLKPDGAACADGKECQSRSCDSAGKCGPAAGACHEP